MGFAFVFFWVDLTNSLVRTLTYFPFPNLVFVTDSFDGLRKKSESRHGGGNPAWVKFAQNVTVIDNVAHRSGSSTL